LLAERIGAEPLSKKKASDFPSCRPWQIRSQLRHNQQGEIRLCSAQSLSQFLKFASKAAGRDILMVCSYPSLQLSLNGLAEAGIVVGHRLISDGDECALLPEEMDAFANSVIKSRRASGAARIVARALLAQLGGSRLTALPKSSSGAPIWPNGIVGSLAHDSQVAIAAVGRRDDFAALGVDIEPPEDLPFELDLIATPRERLKISSYRYTGRLLFTAKEAVYKAVHPLDNVFLEHHDIEIDFEARKALVRGGRILDLRFSISSRLATMAFIRSR
jgi:4'-phosphopantetheinyl transferase EntD